MKRLVLGTLSALALGLLATSAAPAMPANGVVIDQAVPTAELAQPVWWRYRYRWHRYRYWRRW